MKIRYLTWWFTQLNWSIGWCLKYWTRLSKRQQLLGCSGHNVSRLILRHVTLRSPNWLNNPNIIKWYFTPVTKNSELRSWNHTFSSSGRFIWNRREWSWYKDSIKGQDFIDIRCPFWIFNVLRWRWKYSANRRKFGARPWCYRY